MRKQTASLLCLVAISVIALAAPVDASKARLVAQHQLQRAGIAENPVIELYTTFQTDGIECFHIFNFNNRGFIIVGADDRCTPIIGYSANGVYDEAKLPTNMQGWVNGWAQEIAAGIKANTTQSKVTKHEWDELMVPTTFTPSAKSNDHLLSSTWEQGSGYNKYCPVMDGEPVVVGCVATAMAQIIKYYEYPTRGFGHKSYIHTVYGTQAVNFDTTEYDYSLMPDHVSWRASDAQIDMVSRLCYHCGITVNMEYQHAGHTSGSGAHTRKLPEAFLYFGYTDVEFLERVTVNDDERWAALIREEIDNQRPIEYSGFGESGGHAFVLDGYNDQNQYHFNWGWGGYCDGFYTLTTMQGFVNNHDMATHIFPSGWDGHLERFYATPNGNGDGTTWAQGNNNIQAAVRISSLVNRDIWLKEGIYRGDTAAEYAFAFNNKANIYGGFDGTETALSQRDAAAHPSILDGQGIQPVLRASANSSSNNAIKLTDIILQNGYSTNGTTVYLNGNVHGNRITIRNCQSDSGSVAELNSAKLIHSHIYGNQGHVACRLNDGVIRQSLIYNNTTDEVIRMESTSRMVNNTIASNTGIGVAFNHARNTFINNIVWNNDTSLLFRAQLNDTCLRSCAIESDTAFADSTLVQLSADNNAPNGPRFVMPSATSTEESNWHLGKGSVCIDAGERLAESISDGDMEGSIRSRNGRIDLGCYESNYPVSINAIETAEHHIYPNPATSFIHLVGYEGQQAFIYDMSGRQVMKVSSNTADISRLAAGLYYLRCQGRTEKFVKE